MARPSHQTDQRLIDAALELMPKTGLGALKVRQVAARAGVNLGMFHYHFKSKQEFNRRVLQTLYERFFERLTGAIAAAGGAAPRERLRAAVLTLARFAREHRAMMLAIARDVLDRNPETLRFIRENFPRHGMIMFRLVKDCQRAGAIRRLPLPAVVATIAAPQALPVIGVAVLEHVLADRILGFPVRTLAKLLLTDKAMALRLDLSLQAVAPAGGRA
jgi:AcrR family transcriptional regulator